MQPFHSSTAQKATLHITCHSMTNFATAARTVVLLNALLEQHLDAAVIDIRDMRPSGELRVSLAFEMSAGGISGN